MPNAVERAGEARVNVVSGEPELWLEDAGTFDVSPCHHGNGLHRRTYKTQKLSLKLPVWHMAQIVQSRSVMCGR